LIITDSDKEDDIVKLISNHEKNDTNLNTEKSNEQNKN
jgi:hypothetical protein